MNPYITTTSATSYSNISSEYLFELYYKEIKKIKVIEKQTIFMFDEKDCDKWPVEKN